MAYEREDRGVLRPHEGAGKALFLPHLFVLSRFHVFLKSGIVPGTAWRHVVLASEFMRRRISACERWSALKGLFGV